MAGPPAPPPPPPPAPLGLGSSGATAPKPAASVMQGRDALLGDIRKGMKLKKAETNDRSAPLVGGGVVGSGSKLGSANGSAVGSAPPIPGMGAPQLGDILAGGIPTLRKVSRGQESQTGNTAGAPPVPGMPPAIPTGKVPPLPTSNIPAAPSIAAPSIPSAPAPSVPSARPKRRSHQKKSSISSLSSAAQVSSPPAIPTTGAPPPPKLPSSAPPVPGVPSSQPPPPPPAFLAAPAAAVEVSSSKGFENGNTAAVPSGPPSGLPFLAEINARRSDASSVDGTRAPAVPSAPSAPPVTNPIALQPSSQAPPLPSQAPPLPSQAPPLPSQAPPLPGQAPPLPSQAPSLPPLAPPLPSQSKAKEAAAAAPPAPPLPPQSSLKPETAPAPPAPPAPPLPSQPTTQVRTAASPPAPPAPQASQIFRTSTRPSSTAAQPQAAPTPGGPLPFLSEIQRKRDDRYVVGGDTGYSTKQEQSDATASAPASSVLKVDDARGKAGGPMSLMGEIESKLRPRQANQNGSDSRVPSLPSAAPPLPTAAPPLPTSAPPLPTAAPPLPTAGPPQQLSSDIDHSRSSNRGSFLDEIQSSFKHHHTQPSSGATNVGHPESEFPIPSSPPTSAPPLPSAVPQARPPPSNNFNPAQLATSAPKIASPPRSVPATRQQESESEAIQPITKAPPRPPSKDQTDNIKQRLFSSGESSARNEDVEVSQLTINGSNNTTGVKLNSGKIVIDDSRFKWANASQIPRPRPYQNRTKLYPSGKGSSVPLDLSLFT
ncbi:hypothetical protein HG537_0F03430 [Torulaspora globosa]|uniref:WH2 domain-containing protein n=1 Tax=Torulaspora globosa TaxID=48254 RepID=A0A7H9HYP8_9SACH|nr:hypothetical protein HG537_0F03430 [Torulaspora sp. CBS 2947]